MTTNWNEIWASARAKVAKAESSSCTNRYLVGYDANGIQQYIGAAGKPAMLQGASNLVVKFDRDWMSDPACLFAAGGRGRFLVAGEGAAQAKAMDLRDMYWTHTQGEILGTGYVKYDGEPESLRRLAQTLRIAKDSAPPPQWFGYATKLCSACYLGPAAKPVHSTTEGDRTHEVCSRCYAQWEHRNDGQREERLSMDALAENQQIATVVADGNRTGHLFDSLKSLEQQAAMSEAVKSIFSNAARIAHEEADILCSANQPGSRNPKGSAVLRLVAGGDDIKAFMSPKLAPRFVATLCREIETHSAAMLKAWKDRLDVPTSYKRMEVGVGLLVSHSHYPASRLIQHAGELESRAKNKAESGSAVGFLRMGSSSELIDGIAEGAPSYGVYSLPDGWEEALRRAKALAKVTSSQLAWLYGELRSQDAAASTAVSGPELQNTLRYQVARSPNWQGYMKEATGNPIPDARAIEEATPSRVDMDLARCLESQR